MPFMLFSFVCLPLALLPGAVNMLLNVMDQLDPLPILPPSRRRAVGPPQEARRCAAALAGGGHGGGLSHRRGQCLRHRGRSESHRHATLQCARDSEGSGMWWVCGGWGGCGMTSSQACSKNMRHQCDMHFWTESCFSVCFFLVRFMTPQKRGVPIPHAYPC